MKKVFAAAAVAGLFAACMEMGDPIQADPSDLEGSSSDTTPSGAIDRVYQEVLALLFPDMQGGPSVDITRFSEQASAGCAAILENPPSSLDEVDVPPAVTAFAGGFVLQLESAREEGFNEDNMVVVMHVMNEVVRIYDENIDGVREELPETCNQLLTATGGHYYMPDTGREFVERVLQAARDLEMITKSEQDVLGALLLVSSN